MSEHPPGDVVGNEQRSWTTSRGFRGNIYALTAPSTLQEFAVYLDPSDRCELGFFVYDAPERSGPFRLIWSSVTKARPGGRGFYRSGLIGTDLSAGRHVVLGVGWLQACRYFSSAYGDFDRHALTIGLLDGNAFDNAYPGYQTGFVPSNSYDGSGANYYQIVHAVPRTT